MEKLYLRNLRILMNPGHNRMEKEMAEKEIRRSMHSLLEANKLETEISSNNGKRDPKDMILMKRRLDQVKEENKGENQRKGMAAEDLDSMMEDDEDEEGQDYMQSV